MYFISIMCPKKIELTKRQKRLLELQHLWPLTGVEEASERTGIPMTILRTLERPSAKTIQTSWDLVQKFNKNPKTRRIIHAHPKLWRLQRIAELAPNYSPSEIGKILLEEAKEKNKRKASQGNPKFVFRSVVTNVILKIIRMFNLRTEEDRIKILSRIRRKRVKNQLTRPEKDALLIAAEKFIMRSHQFKEGLSVPTSDLRQTVLEDLVLDVNYFNPGKHASLEELTEKWLGYLNKILRFRIIDALRKIGPVRRTGNLRHREFGVDDISIHRDRRKPALEFETDIKFNRPLTETEAEVLSLLKQNLTQKQIANRRGTRIPSVSRIIKNIRAKVTK